MAKERDVFNVENYKSLSGRKSDLSTKLSELHEALSTLSQDTAQLPRQLKDISSILVQPKILNHSDRDVRLLTSCCIVDILRVYAPESPITDEETIDAFEEIVKLLHGLANHDASSSMGEKLLYILTSLATIKSCVVPVILAQAHVKGAEDIVTSMMETLISSVRPSHSEEGMYY
jgi:sister chromatid cohesion protein PDS5